MARAKRRSTDREQGRGLIDDMSGFLVLLAQAVIYFAAMAAIFHYRAAIGIGVFYAVLGAMHFLDQIGLFMVWGTVLLFVDLFALIIVYERLGVLVTNTIPGRIFMSLAIVLSFDQALFFAGLHLLSGVPLSAFYGGWIAKIGAAGFFSLMLTLYLRFVDTSTIRALPLGAIDVFDRLTYRHRYEQMVQRIGRDALTRAEGPGTVRY